MSQIKITLTKWLKNQFNLEGTLFKFLGNFNSCWNEYIRHKIIILTSSSPSTHVVVIPSPEDWMVCLYKPQLLEGENNNKEL